MGKADNYKHGDWNAICDTCGMKYKASELKLTWDNYLVCTQCWEPRQPQDFVRGKIDKQAVPPHLSRPDQDNKFTTTTLNGAVAKGATSIEVDSASGLADYTTIGIELTETPQDASGITDDNVTSAGKVIHWTFVDDSYSSGTTIPISEKMPGAAADGNTVHILHDDQFLGVNEVTVESLG